MDQLIIYAGLYCLINHVDPFDIDFELRIYQNDEVIIDEPDSQTVSDYMVAMVNADDIVRELRKQEAGYVY